MASVVEKNISSQIFSFLKEEKMTNVTLTAEGKMIKAHKLILAASSKFFEELFIMLEEKHHPVIVLKDISMKNLTLILEYIYCGNVDIPPEEIQEFKEAAESLQIKIEFEDPKEVETDDSSESLEKMSQEDLMAENSRDDQEMRSMLFDETMGLSYEELMDSKSTLSISSIKSRGRKFDYETDHKKGPAAKKKKLTKGLKAPCEKRPINRKCLFCDRQLREKDRTYHQRYCWKNKNRVVSDCRECDRSFDVPSKLRHHLEKEHFRMSSNSSHQQSSIKTEI